MQSPSPSPKEQFLLAARAGSVSGMQEACCAGASPYNMPQVEFSVWGLVASAAPARSMKACFAFLKEAGVPLFSSDNTDKRSHPALLLSTRDTLSLLDQGRTFWRLWNHLTTLEQKSVVHTDDLDTYFSEREGKIVENYRDTLAAIWDKEEHESHNFLSLTYRVYLKTGTPSLLNTSLPRPPLSAQPAVLFSVRSLSLKEGRGCLKTNKEDAHWGVYFATAPRHVLQECLSHPEGVLFIQERLTASLKVFLQDGLSTQENVQQVALRILRRCHNAGLRWPDQWPPKETQEVLRAFPHIQPWIDKQALTSSINPPSSLSPRRPRL